MSPGPTSPGELLLAVLLPQAALHLIQHSLLLYVPCTSTSHSAVVTRDKVAPAQWVSEAPLLIRLNYVPKPMAPNDSQREGGMLQGEKNLLHRWTTNGSLPALLCRLRALLPVCTLALRALTLSLQ